MKKVLLSLCILAGLMGANPVLSSVSSPKEVAAAQCKYTLKNATAGLDGLDVTGFVPGSESPDRKKNFRWVTYHNPASSDPSSTDAIVLVLVSADSPEKALILLVSYETKRGHLIYSREIKEVSQPDGSVKKTLTLCFTKELVPNK